MPIRVAALTVALLTAIGISAFAADARYTMVRSDSLTVIGDQPASTLRDIAIQLEQFRVVVAGLIHDADRPPALPTLVYVFGSKKAMQPYVPLVNGKPATIDGFFQRDTELNAIVLSLEDFDESTAIAYHEYTHLLVGNAVRSIPVWLNEGLADYYSTYRLAENGREAEIGRPPAGRLAVLREESLPIAELITVDQSSALYNEGDKRSIFYAEAWALTHYILTQVPNGGAAINQYAGEIAEGRAPHEAFYSAFGSSPAEFDKLLRQYVQRSKFAGTKFTFKDKVSVATPGAPRSLGAGESAAWLGDLQRRLGREAEAAPRIDAALMAEPDVAVTHLAAGLLRVSQQRINEGLLELQRAATLAPDDFLTQFLHGVWQLRVDLPGATENSDSAAAALKRATTLNPQSSDAQAWLAYAQMQKTETLRDARASIERAITLAPGRVEYRLRWADIRILQGANDDARKLLTAIAALRSDQRAADAATQRLQTLADYEQRAANYRESFWLRRTEPGEQRALGLLTRIDCAPTAVRFHVTSGDRTIVTTAARLEDVDLISYRDDMDLALACGPRPQPEQVYVTWTPAASAGGPSGEAGTAVAIEFLPKSFVPKE